MTLTDYRWYVQDAINQCDNIGHSRNQDFSKLIDQIIKIKKIGAEMKNPSISDYAKKIFEYDSEAYKLDLLDKMIYLFIGLRFSSPLSNKEAARQRRYLIEIKLFLHGVDEELRKLGY